MALAKRSPQRLHPFESSASTCCRATAACRSRRTRRAARTLLVFSEPKLSWSDACLNFLKGSPLRVTLPEVRLDRHGFLGVGELRILQFIQKSKISPPLVRIPLRRNRISTNQLRPSLKKKNANTPRHGRFVVHMRSAIYHELPRRQPKLEGKCVSVGVGCCMAHKNEMLRLLSFQKKRSV